MLLLNFRVGGVGVLVSLTVQRHRVAYVSPISLLFQDSPEFSAEAEAEASYVAGFPVPLPLPPGPPVRLD